MDGKEILIDRVNVAECDRYIPFDTFLGVYKTPVKAGSCKNIGVLKCEGTECIFKQLAREKQKNKKLQKQLEALQIQDDENIVYEVSEYEFNRANKYEQALKEIGTICNDYWNITTHAGYDEKKNGYVIDDVWKEHAGKELYEVHKVFEKLVKKCDEALNEQRL